MGHVLLVENDEDIRDLVSTTLRRDGHVVETAIDGDEGWVRLQQGSFDLAIFDWMMPGHSGLELVTLARADPRLASLPIMMLTARAADAEVQQALDAGVTVYFTKPFSPRILVAEVAALLERAGP